MSPSASVATKEKILDVAEMLFAEHGFNGTSLRLITDQAGVNLASVNYHFGDKENLYIEVVRRRIIPINRTRLVQLERVIALAGSEPPPLSLVIEALIQPVFETHQDPTKGGRAAVQIIARTLHEPLRFTQNLIDQEFQVTFARFSQAVRKSIPHLLPDDFMWRISFVVGAMHHTLAMIDQMEPFTRGICKNNDYERALNHFISYSIAVFAAEPSHALPPRPFQYPTI